VSHKQPRREDTPESSGAGEIIIPRTPKRAGESQGGTTITLALRTPERLRGGPDLAPRLSPPLEPESSWQLPASTAPPETFRYKRLIIVSGALSLLSRAPLYL
jgi:hypothetical protein